MISVYDDIMVCEICFENVGGCRNTWATCLSWITCPTRDTGFFIADFQRATVTVALLSVWLCCAWFGCNGRRCYECFPGRFVSGVLFRWNSRGRSGFCSRCGNFFTRVIIVFCSVLLIIYIISTIGHNVLWCLITVLP